MGLEFYQNLQATYGSQLMSFFENENGIVDTASNDYDTAQLSNDFQQISFEGSEQELPLQTPHKERVSSN